MEAKGDWVELQKTTKGHNLQYIFIPTLNDIHSFSSHLVEPAAVVVVAVGCGEVPGEVEGAELEDGAHGFGSGFVFGAPWGVDGPGGVAPGGWGSNEYD